MFSLYNVLSTLPRHVSAPASSVIPGILFVYFIFIFIYLLIFFFFIEHLSCFHYMSCLVQCLVNLTWTCLYVTNFIRTITPGILDQFQQSKWPPKALKKTFQMVPKTSQGSQYLPSYQQISWQLPSH